MQPAPSLDLLGHLQMQHLLTVPFENFSVMHQEPILLTTESLYDKIVRRRRGGFCYELNTLFGALLTRLGFGVQMLSAQVYQSDKQQFGPPFDHMVLCVTLDDKPDSLPYLVDVGFGDSCRTPLALPTGHATDISGTYRVRPVAPAQNMPDPALVLEVKDLEVKDEAQNWTPCYRFSMQPHNPPMFDPMCKFHSSDLESGFTRRLICSIATPKGRYTLSNDRLLITLNGQKHELPITESATYDRILNAYFGVNIHRRMK